MNRRRIHISLYLLSFLLLSCGEKTTVQNNKEAPDCDSIQLLCSKCEIYAGEDFTFKSDTKIESDQWIILSNTWSLSKLKLIQNNEGEYLIPGNLLKKSGVYQIKIICNENEISNLLFEVIARKGYKEIDAYLGPTSLMTRTEDEAMLITVPLDTFGNVLKDEMYVDLRTRIGGDPEILSNIKINRGLSYKIFGSDAKPAKMLIGAKSDKALLTEQDFLIQSALPDDFELQIVTQFPFADGRQYTHLRTNRITDKYGNQLEEGTLVWLSILSDSGNSDYRSFTVGGVANFYIQNPENETVLTIVAGSAAARSNKVKLTYMSNIKSFDVRSKDGFIVGENILAGMNQKAVDGTLVKLAFYNNDQEYILEVESVEGGFKEELRLSTIGFSPKRVKVTIGEITKELKLEE